MPSTEPNTRWGPPVQEFLIGSLHTPIGGLVARPWFDKIAIRALAHWFFPLSRLWAAAGAAEGSVERYFQEAEIEPKPGLERSLAKRLSRFEAVRLAAIDMDAHWEEAFFGSGETDNDTLAAIEHDRLFRRNSYNTQRRLFLPFRRYGGARPIAWDTPAPEDVAALYGAHDGDPGTAFSPPDPMPDVVRSRAVEGETQRDYWLRFRSPSERMNDFVTARVYEPTDVEDPPTIILGHGICVEFDHWRGLTDEAMALAAMGIRVVRPEAPWHGRRTKLGRYGGEQFIATAPLGGLDLFTSAAREWSVLIDWFRRKTTKPIAIGGTSLGALTAQLVADKSRHWPERLKPDALLLITHCGHIADAVTEGSLARVWGIAERTQAEGWSPEHIDRYAPLIDPGTEPVMAAEKIVSVLGERDEVTPFGSGLAMLDRWSVPQANRYIWHCGHFSVPLAMLRDHKPLEHFGKILKSSA